MQLVLSSKFLVQSPEFFMDYVPPIQLKVLVLWKLKTICVKVCINMRHLRESFPTQTIQNFLL